MKSTFKSTLKSTLKSIQGFSQGFTMLELLITLLLLGILITVVVNAVSQLSRSNTQSEIKSSASVAAQKTLDALRVQTPSSMPLTGADAPLSVATGGRIFMVTVSYCPDNNASGYCKGNARQVRAVVQLDGENITSVDTVFTDVNTSIN